MKRDQSLFSQGVTCLLAVALSPLMTGCEVVNQYSFTHKLWSDTALINHYEPAQPAHLKLFQDRHKSDVLVQYDESREKNGAVRPRAFFLRPNLEKLAEGGKPHFVKPSEAEELQIIPVVSHSSTNAASIAAGAPGAEALHAEVSADGTRFTLFSGDQEIGAYDLPVYVDPSSHTTKILVTPFALVGDAVLIGAFGAVLMIIGLAHTGFSGTL
jgi:hypothetical protein